MPCGPFESEAAYRAWAEPLCLGDDPRPHAIIDLDTEKPVIKSAFQTWLDPDNFDADGKQKTSLSELTARTRETL